MKEHAIEQMLFDLADHTIQVLPKETGCDGGRLRRLWQRGWERARAESDGDLVRLADAACEELKMLILATLMECEQQGSSLNAYSSKEIGEKALLSLPSENPRVPGKWESC